MQLWRTDQGKYHYKPSKRITQNPSPSLINCLKFNILKYFLSETDKIQYNFQYKQMYNKYLMRLRKTAKYAKISLNIRLKLIEMTSRSNISISKAARTLGLKSSTAKLIVKRYREEGTFFESRNSKAKRLERLQVEQEYHIQIQVVEETNRNEARPVENHSNQYFQRQPSPEVAWAPILMWSAEHQSYYWMMAQKNCWAFQ